MLRVSKPSAAQIGFRFLMPHTRLAIYSTHRLVIACVWVCKSGRISKTETSPHASRSVWSTVGRECLFNERMKSEWRGEWRALSRKASGSFSPPQGTSDYSHSPWLFLTYLSQFRSSWPIKTPSIVGILYEHISSNNFSWQLHVNESSCVDRLVSGGKENKLRGRFALGWGGVDAWKNLSFLT